MSEPAPRQQPASQRDYNPVTVPFRATPVGEPMRIDEWAQRVVWTDSMLTTLMENTVKGGKWHTLIDKVYRVENLAYAAFKVTDKKGASGIDGQTFSDFQEREQAEIQSLHEQLRNGTYQPIPVRRAWIPKPGSLEKRPLGIPTVRDRVAQTALVHVIEPILDRTFHERSFGFRHGTGCHNALRCVEGLLESGHVYVVDADLKSYFDSIPKDRLLEIVKEKISDQRILGLIKQFLDQGIMEDLQTWTPETGVPQGAVISPVLSNAYLNPLDHEMAASGFQMVRYADDFVILCRTPEEAERALDHVKQWVEAHGLALHPEKTRIVDYREKSFAFLGYVFRANLRFPREQSHQKFLNRIRELTPRKSGEMLQCTIRRLNRSTNGWFLYFRHCHWSIYRKYDGFIRRRLRRILLKHNRRNPLRLSQTQRWTNDFFAANGFQSLNERHGRFVKSTGTY